MILFHWLFNSLLPAQLPSCLFLMNIRLFTWITHCRPHLGLKHWVLCSLQSIAWIHRQLITHVYSNVSIIKVSRCTFQTSKCLLKVSKCTFHFSWCTFQSSKRAFILSWCTLIQIYYRINLIRRMLKENSWVVKNAKRL